MLGQHWGPAEGRVGGASHYQTYVASFGVDITSDQPIVVERAMYSDAIGQIWAAGTNATATRLP